MNIKYVKFEILLPEKYIEEMRNQLNRVGMLTVGNYDQVVSYTHVQGFWRPLAEAEPFHGEKGVISSGTECRLEFRCLNNRMDEAKEIIQSVHPYEEPIINIIPLLNE
ncbi:cytochrome C biogenesis protein [Cytobacillus purgationiresistens]|uniref:Cytochrome C biogenesis protein n=1 Tax=Cytobacillus purgationiresistens TaxID=863449 RepID=A0ABU0AAX7_9BACI|nr:cytochrome C biogenesis protein [Cytobacillus purgationiresistens]MDQ0268397.1 hypothetical protein [Cytobacillus purgationiresistens]